MSKDAKITIHPQFKTGDISRRLFSTFLEPIGTMVNGTMYNPKHPTADEEGFRTDIIEALKKTGMPAIRLPGGNFVSGWDWKNSIGPKEERRTVLDPAWYQYYTNQVGHDEYLSWAEKVGTEPMYTVNLGTGDIRDAMAIVEYTNHKDTSYWAELRRKNGHDKPYGVKTWYLGNEMDGPWQLGSWEKDPRGYGNRTNEVSKVVKWIDPSIETAVCGSSAPFMDHFPRWDEEVLEQCYESVDYLSIHHYHIAPPGDLKALLGGSLYYEDFINTEVSLCDLVAAKMRSPKKVMISFDEYGSMVRPLSPLNPGYGPHNMYRSHYVFNPERKYIMHDPDNMEERIFPGSEMVHALSMASIQLALLRHADRVKIGCMTGGLGALCASNHDHVWKSASFYPFTDLIEYAKGTALNTAVESEAFDIPGYAIDDNSQYPTKEGVPYIDAASAWDEDKERVAIFVINKSDSDEYPLTIDASGFEGYHKVCHKAMYTEDIDARNSFEDPDIIKPATVSGVTFEDGKVKTYVKPLSWNVIILEK